jgi:hypothetical protein
MRDLPTLFSAGLQRLLVLDALARHFVRNPARLLCLLFC